MSSIRDQLTEIHARIARAVKAVETDRGATQALQAVVQEFHRVSHKALGLAAAVDAQATLAPIIELEQAGESAMAAAAASSGISAETLRAIGAARDTLRDLKAEFTGG